jgi:hypothetical protein
MADYDTQQQEDIQPDGPVYDGREPESWEPPPAPDPQIGRDVKYVELEMVEDPRDQIVENYRAKRDQDAAETLHQLTGAMQADAEQHQEPEQQYYQEDSPPPPGPGGEEEVSPRYRVNVYGEEYEVPVEDLIRNFQINSAAEVNMQTANERLAEANRLLAMAQQAPTNGNGGYSPPQQDPQPQTRYEAPTHEAAPNDDEELRQFVETMQLGSTDEAVEAARRLLSRNAAPQQPVDISGQVERVIAVKADDSRSTAAMTEFFDAFPVLDDPISLGALHEASKVEMAKDLATTGLPFDDIMSLDQSHIVKYHRLARLQNRPGFRQPDEILGTVARNPRFRDLAQSAYEPDMYVDVDRSWRKQMVQQQPALRSAPPQRQQEERRTPEQKGSDVVAQMRRERGQVGIGV